jgi:hypothetical protein
MTAPSNPLWMDCAHQVTLDSLAGIEAKDGSARAYETAAAIEVACKLFRSRPATQSASNVVAPIIPTRRRW